MLIREPSNPTEVPRMSSKAKVAVLRTKPDTVLDDYERLLDLADVEQHLDRSATTILKDNISWHFPFPSANSTPWQLEGTIVGLRKAGYDDLVCVQNKTVVTNAFKGEDLNQYVPVFRHHDVPVKFNFREQDMRWEVVQAEAPRCSCSTRSSRTASRSPTTSTARTSSTCRRRSATSTPRRPAR